MDEKINGLDKKIIVILLRVSTFLLLLGHAYLVFSSNNFSAAFWLSLPIFWYTLGQYAWLILPVLFNLAIWCPKCYSYLFLKSILQIEKYRLSFVFFISMFIAITSPFVSGIIFEEVIASARISGGALLYVLVARAVINHKDYKPYFGGSDESQDFRYGYQKYVYIFVIYLGIFIIGLTETSIAYSRDEALAERTPRTVYALENLAKIDIAVDKEMYLGTFLAGPFNGDVGIYSLKTGEEIKKLGVKDVLQSCFIPNSQDILVRKLDASGNGKSWHYEIVDMDTVKKKMRMEQTVHGDGFFAQGIFFNSVGRYFATTGKGMSIWDCREGREIAYFDSKNYAETLAWTSEKAFLVVITPKQVKEGDENSSLRSVAQYEVEENHEKVRMDKEKITTSLRQKINELREKRLNVKLEKGHEENTVLLIVSGEVNSENLSENRTYLEIWNTEKEELLFSLILNRSIMGVQIHPDKKRLVVFDGNLASNLTITYWDIESQEKESERHIAKLEMWLPSTQSPALGKSLTFIEQGKKFIRLENKLYMVTLEE